MAELFLVLSDSHVPPKEHTATHATSGRGMKHRMDDDQMSVQSTGSKRQDVASSAEKSRKTKQGKGARNKFKS